MKVFSSVLIMSLVLLFGYVLYRPISPSRSPETIKNVTSTPSPAETILSTLKSQRINTDGKSYGIFYPYTDGVTINNSLPTIIGKVPQNKYQYLATNMVIEKSVVSGEKGYFLYFNAGRVSGLAVKIDGVATSDIFGIPQYPNMDCKTLHVDKYGTTTWNPITMERIPPDDIYNTTERCISSKNNEVPPLIFFTKPKLALSQGQHVLTIEGKSTFQSLSFTVGENYQVEQQATPLVDKNKPYYYQRTYPLIQSDTCAEGYYYTANFLKIPIPSFGNKNLLYSIAFPQSKTELENTDSRRVQIAFGQNRFDLFFPDWSVFYGGKSLNYSKDGLNPSQELFLPKDHLVFSNGSRASYIDAYSIIPQDSNYEHGYFEIYPTDMTGGKYSNSSIPWVTSGSSGCDG